MIPLMLSLAGRTAVIFGGGRVAARKAAFLSGEIAVRVISRSFLPEFDSISCDRVVRDIDGIPDEELGSLVREAFLVVGALPDPRENDRIGRVCRENGVFFDNADGEEGDVIIPSVARGRNYCIAVSTYGKSPAVSRYVREYIQASLPSVEGMIDLQERLRALLKNQGITQAKRAELLNAAVRDDDVWKTLSKNPKSAWALVEERYARY